jgi:hypothetical protein
MAIGNDFLFKSLVFIGIFENAYDRFCGQSMAPAFWRDRRFPSGVFGPVLFCALNRLAAICRSVAMVGLGLGRQGR